ncbi:hypothetical protein [Glutamicibacter soli]
MKRNAKIVLGTAAVAVAAGGIVAGSLIGANRDAQAGGTSQDQQLNLADVATTDPQSGAKVLVDAESQVVKELGEPGKLTVDGTTKPSFEITVKDVKVMNSCTLRGSGEKIKPENGYFLLVDAEAWLDSSAEKYVDEEIALMPLDASVFGTSAGLNQSVDRNVATVAAFSCDVKDAMDIAVGAGDRVKGKIMLDSPHRSGQVVYDPEGTGGWTWDY